MDQATGEQLVKQLKRLNRWVTMFGTFFLVTVGIIGFILFQLVTFVKSGVDKVGSFGGNLNVQQKACAGDGAVGDFFKKNGLCN